MRLFEAILIVLAGQLALAVAVTGGRGPRWTNLLPLVLLAPLAAHLAFEAVRGQMAPAYVAALGLCIAGTVRYARGNPARAHAALTVMGITCFVLLMLSAAAVAILR